jgi:hypothetical protein
MSEPAQWGPPRFDAAPRPTAAYPTAPHPAGHRAAVPPPAAQDRTAFLATTPIPTVRAEIPRSPAQSPRPADDEYDDYASGRPRRRGQVFAGLVLLLALAVSALMYYLTYQTLSSVDIVSSDPLGNVGGQVMSLGAVMFGALAVFVLALIAFVIARPKALAGLGLAASLLLPVAALVLGLWYGGSVLRQNVESDIAQAGPEVAAQGAAAVTDAIVQELERRGIDAGPVRDLITSVVGQGG